MNDTLEKQDFSLDEKFNFTNLNFSNLDIQKKLPKVNLKRLKLAKLKDLSPKVNFLDFDFKDEHAHLIEVLGVKEKVEKKEYETKILNPLRKKNISISNEILNELENKNNEVLSSSLANAFTAELEVQSNIDITEETSNAPKRKKVFYIDSENISDLTWPKKASTKPKKKKTYFVEENPPISIKAPEEAFPWMIEESSINTLDEVVKGGLEAQLLDIPDSIQEENNTFNELDLNQLFKPVPEEKFEEGTFTKEIKIEEPPQSQEIKPVIRALRPNL